MLRLSTLVDIGDKDIRPSKEPEPESAFDLMEYEAGKISEM